MQSLPIVAFTDLDDTLFSTLRKHRPDADLQPQAYLKDGAAISYSDARQRALQQWLATGTRVVPVTARSIGAYQRVRLPFNSYAVISHGACVLLPDGTPDPQWTGQMQTLLSAAAEPLAQAYQALLNSPQNASAQLRVTLVTEHGQPLYALAKHAQGDEQAVAELAECIAQPWVAAHSGFQLHVNGNNLAIIPPGIGKAAAVQYVRAQLLLQIGDFMSIGLGDSLTDGAFMLDCDYALMPSRSQLSAALRTRLHGV